jgi:pimeloyl-ACP methyl ester carboxylesterase
VPPEEWAEQARAWFNDDGGLPALGYDPNIAKSFSSADGPMPELWPQLGALAAVPVLAIRGEHSDILSAKTLEEMRSRHPQLDTFVVRGQGHAPLLRPHHLCHPGLPAPQRPPGARCGRAGGGGVGIGSRE